jgi:hypothetical protein
MFQKPFCVDETIVMDRAVDMMMFVRSGYESALPQFRKPLIATKELDRTSWFLLTNG